MKRVVLWGLGAAAIYGAYKAVKVWPSFKGDPNRVGVAVRTAINPIDPFLYVAAGAGALASWVLK